MGPCGVLACSIAVRLGAFDFALDFARVGVAFAPHRNAGHLGVCEGARAGVAGGVVACRVGPCPGLEIISGNSQTRPPDDLARIQN